ncbi:AI-2E family transporter [Betaproteobacteria bacterium]|nr:AI-2E family transporter [Betaproteobacteria bacterium]GHT99194.1 AI-2E family transporter [Betaproteobacteria bacterium]GHU23107.1 AI-2E family transporter [Betaproteobacteria bacterium]
MRLRLRGQVATLGRPTEAYCLCKPEILLEMPITRATRLQTALWGGLALSLLLLLWLLSPILAPFAIAAVFAYLGDPAVNWLVRHRLPRPWAVLTVIAALCLVFIGIALGLLPLVYRETLTLVQRLPRLIELFNERLSPLLAAHLDTEIRLDAAQLQTWLGQHKDSAQELLPTLLSHLGQGGMALLGILGNLVLIPLVTFYLLQEWPRIINTIRNVLPRPWLPRTLKIAGEIDAVLAEFCRGQLSVMLLLALYYSIGLWIAGLDFALPVGVITGLLIFIPYAGFGGGLALAVLTALLQGGGWGPLIGVGVVYGIGQMLESFLLTPYLVGDRIGLHPVTVIFALMAFGQIFGFVGILVALPTSAALLVGLREVSAAWFASPVYLGAAKATPARRAPPAEAPPAPRARRPRRPKAKPANEAGDAA